MNTLISAGTGLSILACSAEECLSWIIILLNILTVFYLVFCAWYRVTKAVKVIGYVWASALTVGTAAVVALHTCIFTILSAVFTALIVMAVLSVVMGKGVLAEVVDRDEKAKKPFGYYVIHRTDDGKYVFVLYDNAKNAASTSVYKYNSIEEAKADIAVCRESGYNIAVENRTKSWVEYVNHPKFVVFEDKGRFAFQMDLSSERTLLKSKLYGAYELCEKALNATLRIVRSEKTYYADHEVLSGKDYKTAGNKPQKAASEPQKEVVREAAVTEVASSAQADETAVGVIFGNEKKTLWELYAELTATQRGYFDQIRARAEEKEKVKTSESKDAFTVYLGRDKIVKLRIRKNTVEAVFFVTDNAFKKLSDESDAKVKETPTVIKISSDEYLNLALETVDYRYEAIVAERKARRKVK